MPFSLSDIDKTWTLFLDRDGVINMENPGTYVTRWSDFKFMRRVPESIAILKNRFARIVVTTNQRGVSKGLMSLDDLEEIHARMQAELLVYSASVDKIYYCLDGDPSSPCRKPNPGMAIQAAHDLQVNLKKSVMVGNNLSDMLFGRNAGMATVFVTTTNPDLPLPHPAVDLAYPDLAAFTEALETL